MTVRCFVRWAGLLSDAATSVVRMTPTQSDATFDHLPSRLACHVESGAVPGAVALIDRAGEARTLTVGAISIGGEPMRADAIMRIQSMTKPVTTVATLLGVQAGELSLDDPVTRWLPELARRRVLRDPQGAVDDTVEADRDITVRDLLINGSGYGVQVQPTPLAAAMQEAGVDAGAEPLRLGADEWLTALAGLPLAHQPGRGFRYHHSFGILGILLQRLSGRPLEDHLRSSVFEPLGMADTSFSVPESQASRLPAAYRHGGSGFEETEPVGGGFYVGTPPFDVSHGELVSTAADYHRFLRMLAQSGQVGGESFVAEHLVGEMMRDQVLPEAKTPDSFFPGFWDGMGWGYGGAVVTGGEHAGRYSWSGGQGTDFFVDPDGTIWIFLSQVEMDEQMFAVFDDVARAASQASG